MSSESSYAIKVVTIASCGHITCSAGFMGCLYEFRYKLGIVDYDLVKALPGSQITVAVIHNTGFPDKDWNIIGGDYWTELGPYLPSEDLQNVATS